MKNKKNDASVIMLDNSNVNQENIINADVKDEKISFKLYLFFKRIFDILGSCVGLVLLSPLLLIISLIIKFSDGGNVFYSHKRIGLNGKEFKIYKFRSMKNDADKLEEMLTPEQLEIYRTEYKIEEDPRITKFGSFIRKTSLDELPQMINILRGDMSVIGPRPLIECELYTNYEKDEVAAFTSVKPGLTGYWQAYARNSASYESGERQKMELYYVKNQSFWLDVKIFFKTILSVLQRENAM